VYEAELPPPEPVDAYISTEDELRERAAMRANDPREIRQWRMYAEFWAMEREDSWPWRFLVPPPALIMHVNRNVLRNY
jgi:hypothetical protein